MRRRLSQSQTRVFSVEIGKEYEFTDDFFDSMPQLTHVDISCCNLTKLPESIFRLKQLSSLNISWNSLESIPVELGYLKCLRKLEIEGNPGAMIQPYISLMERGDRALIDFLRNVVRSRPRPGPLAFRPYEVNAGDVVFKLVSYNIFAPVTMRPYLYPFNQEKYMDYGYRLPLIEAQIDSVQPDVVCCQEVQVQTFEEEFLPMYRERGFDGVFVPKGRIAEKHPDQKKLVMGQSTFYNLERFEYVAHESFEFRWMNECKESPIAEKIQPVDDVCLIVLLKVKCENPVYLVIVNVHLTWPPYLADVRAVFAQLALDRATQFAQKHCEQFELILTGDYNSPPDTSPVTTVRNHPLGLTSLYEQLQMNNNPTIFMCAIINSVDHIFYTTKRLEGISALPVLNKRQLARYTYFVPCEWHPSDHFPVGGVFRVKQ